VTSHTDTCNNNIAQRLIVNKFHLSDLQCIEIKDQLYQAQLTSNHCVTSATKSWQWLVTQHYPMAVQESGSVAATGTKHAPVNLKIQ